MGSRGRRVVAALAVAAVLMGACSGDNDSDDESTVITDPVATSDTTDATSSTTTTTTDPDAEVKAQVEEAYLAYWDAWLEIFATPDLENPLIDRHTTASVRQVTLDAITDMVLNGRSIQPPDNPADLLTTVLTNEVDGGSATITACLVDGSRVIDNTTGQVVDGELVTLHVRATLKREDDQWKVATSDVLGEREGRWACDD